MNINDYNFEQIRKSGSDMVTKMTQRKEQYSKTMNASYLKKILPNENFEVDWKNIEEVFPDMVYAMKNTPQDAGYHAEGNVWTHTKMVVEAMLSLPEYRVQNSFDKELLFWSTLFHDIGKPGVTTFSDDIGRISSKGHSKRGMQDVRLIMWVAGFDPVMRESVANIIEVHQHPFTWIKKESIFEIRNVSQHLKMNNLILMATADAIGRETLNPLDKQKILENVELFKIACEENNCLNNPWEHNFTNLQAKDIYWKGRGESYEDRPVHEEKRSDVIMLSGLPASGKDTWAKKYCQGREVLSYDAAREMFGSNDKGNGRAVQYVKERAKELLRNNEPFVLNANYLSVQTRHKDLKILREYGATIRMVCLEASLEVSEKRNDHERDTTLRTSKILERAYGWEPPKSNEAHEVIWWKNDAPLHIPYLTSKKEINEVWDFSKNVPDLKKTFKI